MNINITARRFKNRDSYKSAIHDGLSKLKRYYDGNMDCDVVLEYRNKVQIAEFRLKMSGKTLISNKESDLMMKSIELAINDLEGQVKRHKEKNKKIEHTRVTDLEADEEAVPEPLKKE